MFRKTSRMLKGTKGHLITAIIINNTGNLFLIFKTLVLLSVSLVVYNQDLVAIANEVLQTELASYLLALPFLIGYIVYRKRKFLKTVVALEKTDEQKRLDETVGVILCFFALILYLYSSHTFYALELHFFSFPLFVAGCILIIFNMETVRVLLFPLLLLLFLTVPPLEIAYLTGTKLSNIVSEISYVMLSSLGLPIELSSIQGSSVITLFSSSGSPIEYAVEVACSGIYSLLGFIIFSIFIAYIIKGKIWKKVTILLLGFPLIFTLNVLRVILIILIGYWFGQSIAMTLFHTFGSWALIFVGTLLMLFFSEKILKLKIFYPKVTPLPCRHCENSRLNVQNFCLGCGKLLKFPNIELSKRDVAKAAALVLTVVLFASIQVPAIAIAKGPAEHTIKTPQDILISNFFPEISNYSLRFMYRDTTFEQIYGQDASLVYAYTSNGSYPIIWTSLEISKARGLLHNWEVCYAPDVGLGRLTLLDLRDVELSENPLIVGRFYSVNVVESNITETYLYWFGRTYLDNEWKYVKISVWTETYDDDYLEVEEKLLPFGEAIIDYFEYVESWSTANLILSSLWSIFVIMPIALLSLVSMLQLSKKWKAEKLNSKMYRRLLSEDKLIVQAVDCATKAGKATTNSIAVAYQKLSGQPIEHLELLEKLTATKRVGLLKTSIANFDDKQVLIWKLNFKMPK